MSDLAAKEVSFDVRENRNLTSILLIMAYDSATKRDLGGITRVVIKAITSMSWEDIDSTLAELERQGVIISTGVSQQKIGGAVQRLYNLSNCELKIVAKFS